MAKRRSQENYPAGYQAAPAAAYASEGTAGLPAHRRPSPVKQFFIRLLLATIGLIIGVGFFAWNLLGKAGFSRIPIVDDVINGTNPSYVEGGNGTENPDTDPNQGIGHGGVISVYAPEGFPIQRETQKDPNVLNIIIFGIDATNAEALTGNSDAMIVMSLNKHTNSIKLTSLLRDTEVVIPGYEGQPTKLNSAYARGGVGLMINTINQNFDLDIQSFMMFDFWSASAIVDQVGGIMIPVTDEEVAHVNAGVSQFNSLSGIAPADGHISAGGEQLLNGKQAIAWARIRAIGFDYARTSRQRFVIQAMLERFSEQDVFTKMSTASTVLGSIETNLTRFSMVGVGTKYMDTLNEIEQSRVPEDGFFTTNTNNWNMIVDWDQQIPRLHEFIYEKAE